jgi:hypothetical protein
VSCLFLFSYCYLELYCKSITRRFLNANMTTASIFLTKRRIAGGQELIDTILTRTRKINCKPRGVLNLLPRVGVIVAATMLSPNS